MRASGLAVTPTLQLWGVEDDPRRVYFSLLDAFHAGSREKLMAAKGLAEEFLHQQLQKLPPQQHAGTPSPMDLNGPTDLNELDSWVSANTAAVGAEYRTYVASRQRGAPRRYFQSRAHAQYFLTAVAPTKLVDGAWLYGICARWADPALRPLLRIYLEELGDGDPALNHVLLYRRLLSAHDCEDVLQIDSRLHSHLDANLYRQGAIQLALAHMGDEFLPEIVGFNLAYEQLPLHLLITAYELRELGIDPFYFTLHITVDNSHVGHAQRALQALRAVMPQHDRERFMQRVRRGAALSELGLGTCDIIDSFDLEHTLLRILADKSTVGQYMHGDFCRVGGRSVSEWLQEPRRLPEFLEAMQRTGWIKRGEPPENSRFWRLLQGETPRMFGVFTRYEMQVLRDWIHTGTAPAATASTTTALPPPAVGRDQDCSGELPRLRRALAHTENGATSGRDIMELLLPWLAPDCHHRPAGLYATRMFSRLLG